jgi:hypothetical protein
VVIRQRARNDHDYPIGHFPDSGKMLAGYAL